MSGNSVMCVVNEELLSTSPNPLHVGEGGGEG